MVPLQPQLLFIRSDLDSVALYGLEVPCGDVLVPAVPDFPATVSNKIARLYRFKLLADPVKLTYYD